MKLQAKHALKHRARQLVASTPTQTTINREGKKMKSIETIERTAEQYAEDTASEIVETTATENANADRLITVIDENETVKTVKVKDILTDSETTVKITKNITADNFITFANAQVLRQLSWYISHMVEPTETESHSSYRQKTSTAFDRMWSMLKDAYAVMSKDRAYSELIASHAEKNTDEYRAHKKVAERLERKRIAFITYCRQLKEIDRLSAKGGLTPDESKRLEYLYKATEHRKKPLTEDEKAMLKYSSKIVFEYEDEEKRIVKNRLDRDSVYNRNNTAVDLLQDAYYITAKYIGYNTDDIAQHIEYKNGKSKDINVFRTIRNYIQSRVREQERRNNSIAKSTDELIRYKSIKHDDGSIETVEIGAYYVDSRYSYGDSYTYERIERIVAPLKLSAQEKKVLEYRLKGFSLADIANELTEEKMRKEVKHYFAVELLLNEKESNRKLKELEKLSTIYEIYNLLLERGKIGEVGKIEKGTVTKNLDRMQAKFIKIYGESEREYLERVLKDTKWSGKF